MSISLTCLYLNFLIGAHAAPVPVLCGISAALLQYFLLVFFGWTAVEAVYLYRNLVQVLVSQVSQFVLKAGLIVWSKHLCSSNQVYVINNDWFFPSFANTCCCAISWTGLQRLPHQQSLLVRILCMHGNKK